MPHDDCGRCARHAVSPYMDTPVNSVTHGQCHAGPTVTFLVVGNCFTAL